MDFDKELSLAEKLSYSTVRLVCKKPNNFESVGTGYIMEFLKNEETNTFMPTVITNQHVIKDSLNIEMVFNVMENGMPNDSKKIKISIPNNDYKYIIKNHPTADLCAINITKYLLQEQKKNSNLFLMQIGMDLVASDKDMDELDQIEDVIMIGYPIGLIDTYNNKPIFRKGITATHPKFNYNGKKEFLIDIACFHGSSGSPVFLFNEGFVADKHRNVNLGATRLKLLGTVYQNRIETIDGVIEVIDIPTSTVPISKTGIPINLGAVIKASTIKDLEEMFKENIK